MRKTIILAVATSLMQIFPLPATGQTGSLRIRLLNPTIPYGSPVGMLRAGEALRVEISETPQPQNLPTSEHKLVIRYAARQVLVGHMDYGGMGGQAGVAKNLQTERAFDGEQTLTLSPDSANKPSGTLLIQPPPNFFGLFEMELQVMDSADGRKLSTQSFEYAVVVGVPANPLHNITGYDAFNWRYSMDASEGGSPFPNEAEIGILKLLGFSWAHFLGNWHLAHTKRGEYKNLDVLDRWVEATEKQNARIVFMLADAAHAYQGRPATGIPTLSDTAEHWDMNLFREWAETIMSRYGDRIAIWDVWNEPDSKEFAQAEDRDLQALQIVHDLRKKYAPQSKIILSTHTHNGLNYLKKILEKGAGKYLDGIGVHPYRGLPPELPEPDAYAGNPTGIATFLQEMEETGKLLKDFHVEPPDIYITEKNYNLNYLHQYNEREQANMMIRMQILARTLDSVKMFINHAPCNGRLLLPAYPNLVAHLGDAIFQKALKTTDAEIHGYVFSKDDGRVVIPLWSVKGEKIIEFRGLTGQPTVTDIFGNSIPVKYNEDLKKIDSLHLTQSPVYILAPQGTAPEVSRPHFLEIAMPERTELGSAIPVAVRVVDLPVSAAKLEIQALSGWDIAPSSQTVVTSPGVFKFQVSPPTSENVGEYPIVAAFSASDGHSLAVESRDIILTLPKSVDQPRHGIILATEPGSEGLADWKIEDGQATIQVATVDDAPAIQLTQRGPDHAGSIEMQTQRISYGRLSFDVKTSDKQSAVVAQWGPLKLAINHQGKIGYYTEQGNFQALETHRLGEWVSLRILFSAPEGWFRLWVDNRFIGQFALPKNQIGWQNLRFVATPLVSKEPANTFLRNIELARFQPTAWASPKPVLEWSFCGPFPNQINPKTMRRPFEEHVDYLQALGGEAGMDATPGMSVKAPGGKYLRFSPFEKPNALYKEFPMVDFFKVADLNLHQGQGDILTYGMAYLTSPEARDVVLTISSDDGYALWVNHESIGGFNPWPYGQSVGQHTQKYKVRLNKGLNSFLIKVDQGSGSYGFYLDID